MLVAEAFSSENLAPLPAAATFIDIDHQLHSAVLVAVDEVTKVSLTEAPISDGVVVENEGEGSLDQCSVGDDTILVDGAVLAANEVEEVLRDAFAETDKLVPATDARESITSVGYYLAPDSPRPLLGCTGIQLNPICRGTGHPYVAEARPARHSRCGFCRRGTTPRRTNDQGDDVHH
jgi:hypothetical protein